VLLCGEDFIITRRTMPRRSYRDTAQLDAACLPVFVAHPQMNRRTWSATWGGLFVCCHHRSRVGGHDADKLTSEESAKIILRIMKSSGTGPEEIMMRSAAERRFFKDGRRSPEEFEEGLQHSAKRKWIEVQAASIKVTGAGYKAA
jgi:hypothetical protein